jgi:hypothetical protein
MPYIYTVRHAFSHDGRYYTRGNADEIASLPRKVRDRQLEQGNIVEHHVPTATESGATDEEESES